MTEDQQTISVYNKNIELDESYNGNFDFNS